MNCPNASDWDLLAMEVLQGSEAADSLLAHLQQCQDCRSRYQQSRRSHLDRIRTYEQFDRGHDSLREQLMAALPPQPARSRTDRLARGWRHMGDYAMSIKHKVGARTAIGLAVAAVVTIATGAGLFWGLGQPGVAFAQVFQQVMNVQTIRYKWTMTVPTPPAGPQTFTFECTVADRYRMRMAGPNGIVCICDFSQGAGRMLELFPTKGAMFVDLKRDGVDPSKPGAANLLDQWTRLDASSAQSLGYKEIDGRIAEGFEVRTRTDPERYRNEVWVDPQTFLPVRIETGARPGQTPYFNNVLTDFEWNVPVDPSLVDMTPPPGYVVFDVPMNLSKITEADLIDALKIFTDSCGGSFPTQLTLKAIRRDMGRHEDQLPKWVQLLDLLSPRSFRQGVTVTRGLFFAGDPNNGDDWHYAGAGVSLNEPDTPIFWYQPKGSATYHVIYADLSVQDVPPDDLPQVPSVPVESSLQGITDQSSTSAHPAP